jgi:hypothetical protein
MQVLQQLHVQNSREKSLIRCCAVQLECVLILLRAKAAMTVIQLDEFLRMIYIARGSQVSLFTCSNFSIYPLMKRLSNRSIFRAAPIQPG